MLYQKALTKAEHLQRRNARKRDNAMTNRPRSLGVVPMRSMNTDVNHEDVFTPGEYSTLTKAQILANRRIKDRVRKKERGDTVPPTGVPQ